MGNSQYTKIIALTGKGGVGKTSLAAAIVKVLSENFQDKKILAIDADPAIGLSTALNVDVALTINDIRKSIIDSAQNKQTQSVAEILGEAKHKIMDALVEREAFSFIAIGRPESAGCYCKINNYLKEIIKILSKNFDYIVIDGEAGIEQINRRVMEKVSHLIMVSDASKKGLQVINTIKEVADELVMYEKICTVINKVSGQNVIKILEEQNVNALEFIKTDNKLSEFDILGKNIFDLKNNSNIVLGAKSILHKLDIIS